MKSLLKRQLANGRLLKVKSSINKIWRTISTALCFSLFGIGGVVISLTVFPLQRLIYPEVETRKRKARKTVHQLFRSFLNFMRLSGTANFDYKDIEKLSKLNGYLVVANHPSLIDVVALISLIPNADCVVKADLFRNPFMRGVIKSTGYISNSDPERILQACEQSLSAGNNLIIFPEGTRSSPDKSLKFLRTPANIAIRCKAPIFTNLIRVSPTTLTKNEHWYNIPDKKFTFSLISLGEFDYKITDNVSVHAQAKQLTINMQNFYNSALGI